MAGATTGALVCGIFTALFLLHAWAIMVLWNWYVAPLGPPEIGKSTALGLTLVCSMILRTPKADVPDDQMTPAQLQLRHRMRLRSLGLAFLQPFICVGAGWLILHLQ